MNKKNTIFNKHFFKLIIMFTTIIAVVLIWINFAENPDNEIYINDMIDLVSYE